MHDTEFLKSPIGEHVFLPSYAIISSLDSFYNQTDMRWVGIIASCSLAFSFIGLYQTKTTTVRNIKLYPLESEKRILRQIK